MPANIATFEQRFWAFVLDCLVWLVLSIGLSFTPFLSPENESYESRAWIVLGLYWLIDWIIIQAVFGRSIGKLLAGLKLANYSDFDKPRWYKVLFREVVGKLISATVFWLGFVSMKIDEQGRTWHDKMARTIVITKNEKVHKKSVKGFYFLMLIIITVQAITSYRAVLDIVNRRNIKNICAFKTTKPNIKTNHFDFYVEDPSLHKFDRKEADIFERAFDYAFWSTNGLKEKVTRSSICLYLSDDSFEKRRVDDNAGEWAFAYFDNVNNIVHFSPGYWDLDRDKLFDKYYGLGTFVYHEIAHYVINNYFFQNNFESYLAKWTNEGLSQYFSGECGSKDDKLIAKYRNVDWKILQNNDYYTDYRFDIDDYYRQSCLMMNFLVKEYGNNFPREMMGLMVKEKYSTEEALKKITGKTIEELNVDWKKWL